MKWETVKKTVADRVYSGIKYQRHDFDAQATAMMDAIAERRTVQESADDLADRCHKIIMNWDVRMAPKLRELFPQHWPPSLKGGRIGAYQTDDDKCEWKLYKMGPTNS